jgi:elongation factor 1-alpha
MEITIDTTNIPPEIEEKNIEYKWRLLNLTHDRIIKLATQMNWRLNEGEIYYGNEEALYIIGVHDNGEIGGLDNDDLTESLSNLQKIIYEAKAETVSHEIIPTHKGMVAKIYIERKKKINAEELRIGFLGHSGCGKTTLIQFLNTNDKDDGNGKLRNFAIKHPHEMKTGQTSSINYHLIGFNKDNLINSKTGHLTWERIIQRSEKVIELIDFPGNQSFINTTIHGVFSHCLDHIILLIDVMDLKITSCLSHETTNYLYICFNLNIEFTIILTKIDKLNKESLFTALKILNDYLFETYNYGIKLINILDDLLEIHPREKHKRINVIYTSCVTLYNTSNIVKLIQSVQKQNLPKIKESKKEFVINGVIQVPDIGTVVSGVVLKGTIYVGDILLIGPTYQSSYIDVSVVSIHRKQISVNKLEQFMNGTLVVKTRSQDKNITISKKMVLITQELFSNFCKIFFIKVTGILKKWISIGYQYMLFTGNQIEPIIVTDIIINDDDILIFVWIKHNRYIRHLDQCIIKNSHGNQDQLQFGEIIKLHQMIT